MRALIRVTAWEKVSLWRRLLCAFARVTALITLLVILGNILGPPLMIFYLSRYEARKLPLVNVTSQPLADYSVSEAPGTKLSYFGYDFEVPWTGNLKKKPLNVNDKASSGIV